MHTDLQGRVWELKHDWSLQEMNLGDFDGTQMEDYLRMQLFFQKKFGGKEDFPAILKVLDRGWRSRESLLFNWVTPKHCGYIVDFLSRDERVWQLLGAHRLLAARCIASILETLEHLHQLH